MKTAVIFAILLCSQALYAQNIVQVEYYIDTDPGFGNGTQVTITAAPDLDLNFNVDISNISDGLHVLFVRARDDSSKWSLTYTSPFLKKRLDVAPNVTKVEYYIDTDPGFGAGVDIPITAGIDITKDFVVDLSGTGDGLHVLFVRARDDSSKWSLTYTSPFLKKRLDIAPNVTKVEYYIDTDPGFGAGVDIPITAGVNITKDFVVDLSGTGDGLHVLFVRARDDSSKWSLTYTSPFLKKRLAVEPNVTKAEYYIDTDPGFGAGVDIPITAGVDITKDFVVDLSGTGDGLHVLFVRAGDDSSNWSLSYTSPFLKKRLDVEPNVTKAEYYIDTDPGFGAGVDIPITAGVDITKDFVVDLSGTGDGLHVLFVRARDDSSKWSLSYTSPFLKKRLDIEPNVTKAEYYIDTDPGFGAGVDIPITAGVDITKDFVVDLSGTGDGLHVLFVRARDDSSKWSLSYTSPFLKKRLDVAPNITAVEYYFSRPSARTQSFTYSNFAPATDVEVNFTADLSILGIDSTYNMHIHATDENGLSSLEHIHPFTVEFINNPPVAVNDTVTTPEDTTITILVLVNDFDIDGDTITVQSLDTTGTVGTVVIDPGDSTVTYTPKTDFNGTDTFKYVVIDTALTDTATVVVTVTPTNDAPGNFLRLSPPDSSLVPRDSVLFLWTEAPDIDGDSLAYTLTIVVDQIDTSFVVEDTTLVLDFKPFGLPKVQLPVTWSVVASDSILTTGPTNGDGNFTLDRPPLLGDVSDNGEVTSFDAVLILQHTVGLITLTGTSARVADVSGNGTVGAFDAALVLRYVVDAIPCFPADPDCGVLAKRAPVAGTLAWSETQSGDTPGHVELPLVWEDNMGDVISAQFTIQIDTSFAHVEDVVSNLPEDWQMLYSVSDGELKVAMAGVTPISDARLATLRLLMSERESEVTLRGVGSVNEEQEQELGAVRVRYVPKEYALEQNYPNPFNPQTVIRYDLPVGSHITISVFNVVGQKVATLVDEEMDGGSYSVVWDGKDDSARSLASGVYLYRLKADRFARTRKLILMR